MKHFTREQEQSILSEARNYLDQIWNRTPSSAGDNVSQTACRELIRCMTNYRFCYAEDEDLIDEIYEHYLYELNEALKPFRDYDTYIRDSKDKNANFMYVLLGDEYIRQLKHEKNMN